MQQDSKTQTFRKKEFTIEGSSYDLPASLLYHEEVPLKGYLLYVHGGGLLFGTKDDLPEETIQTFCQEGFAILTLSYGLAPYTKLPEILKDLQTSIIWFQNHPELLPASDLPWFLWGRSAGAYLCLIGTLLKILPMPSGILSYYGYGFLEDGWYQTPNPFYCRFPQSAPDLEQLLKEGSCTSGALDQRYGLYVHARQQGNWIPFFFDGKQKEFLREYTFLLHDIPKDFPPVFMTHALQDPDVPFAESKRLKEKLPNAVLHPVSASEHDFDRNPDSFAARNATALTLEFLHQHLS